MEKFISKNENETFEFGKKLASTLKQGDIIALFGEMGAGKTVFVKGLASGLGFSGNVTSPTFTLINEYCGNINLYHFDMFRVISDDSLYSTGFFDYLNGESILAIEWSENIIDNLPSKRIDVIMEYGENERERIITVRKEGDR